MATAVCCVGARVCVHACLCVWVLWIQEAELMRAEELLIS